MVKIRSNFFYLIAAGTTRGIAGRKEGRNISQRKEEILEEGDFDGKRSIVVSPLFLHFFIVSTLVAKQSHLEQEKKLVYVHNKFLLVLCGVCVLVGKMANMTGDQINYKVW